MVHPTHTRDPDQACPRLMFPSDKSADQLALIHIHFANEVLAENDVRRHALQIY